MTERSEERRKVGLGVGLGVLVSEVIGGLSAVVLALAWVGAQDGHLSFGANILVVGAAAYLGGVAAGAAYCVIAWVWEDANRRERRDP